PPSDDEKRLLDRFGFEAARVKSGSGCAECGRTGYKGRMGIHEVLSLDDAFRSMVLSRRADSDYAAYAKQIGLVPMVADGLAKVIEGKTTVAEVFRVTGTE